MGRSEFGVLELAPAFRRQLAAVKPEAKELFLSVWHMMGGLTQSKLQHSKFAARGATEQTGFHDFPRMVGMELKMLPSMLRDALPFDMKNSRVTATQR